MYTPGAPFTPGSKQNPKLSANANVFVPPGSGRVSTYPAFVPNATPSSGLFIPSAAPFIPGAAPYIPFVDESGPLFTSKECAKRPGKLVYSIYDLYSYSEEVYACPPEVPEFLCQGNKASIDVSNGMKNITQLRHGAKPPSSTNSRKNENPRTPMKQNASKTDSKVLAKQRASRYEKYASDVKESTDALPSDLFVGAGSMEEMLRRLRERELIPTEPLVRSENRFVPTAQMSTKDKEQVGVVVWKGVLQCLNKQSPSSFDTVSVSANNAVSKSRTVEDMQECSRVIFEKAVGEAMFSSSYARLCAVLVKGGNPNADANKKGKRMQLRGKKQVSEEELATLPTFDGVDFHHVLLTECYKQQAGENTNTLPKGMSEAYKVSDADGDSEKLLKKKNRSKGIITFVAEQFKRSLVPWQIVYLCLELLQPEDLHKITDIDAMNVLALLYSIGKGFDVLLASHSASKPKQSTSRVNTPVKPKLANISQSLSQRASLDDDEDSLFSLQEDDASMDSIGDLALDSLVGLHLPPLHMQQASPELSHTGFLGTIGETIQPVALDVASMSLTSSLSITTKDNFSSASPLLVASTTPNGMSNEQSQASDSPLLRAWRRAEDQRGGLLLTPLTSPMKTKVMLDNTGEIKSTLVLPNTLDDLQIQMDRKYNILQELCEKTSSLSSRVKFLVKDLITLRRNHWMSEESKAVLEKVSSNANKQTPTKPPVAPVPSKQAPTPVPAKTVTMQKRANLIDSIEGVSMDDMQATLAGLQNLTFSSNDFAEALHEDEDEDEEMPVAKPVATPVNIAIGGKLLVDLFSVQDKYVSIGEELLETGEGAEALYSFVCLTSKWLQSDVGKDWFLYQLGCFFETIVICGLEATNGSFASYIAHTLDVSLSTLNTELKGKLVVEHADIAQALSVGVTRVIRRLADIKMDAPQAHVRLATILALLAAPTLKFDLASLIKLAVTTEAVDSAIETQANALQSTGITQLSPQLALLTAHPDLSVYTKQNTLYVTALTNIDTSCALAMQTLHKVIQSKEGLELLLTPGKEVMSGNALMETSGVQTTLGFIAFLVGPVTNSLKQKLQE